MSTIHVYEIPDDCQMTMRDGCKTLSEKYGAKIMPCMSLSPEDWNEMSGSDGFDFYGKAYDAIFAKHGKGKPPKDIVGEINCPKCGGVLRYRISSYNGHIHGQCEKVGCLAWMQ